MKILYHLIQARFNEIHQVFTIKSLADWYMYEYILIGSSTYSGHNVKPFHSHDMRYWVYFL